ncbi:TrmB family transcriptional regulator (plasmid) [Halorussus limi]|uniref:TrmB family transcriptional regulator n=1 Tax=Halorussus limi TaxID=2938695 RepID=A0A8U0HZI7_9EURY|nr:helix-turn-helix domain-containing protein [Halorussus limi]UPV76337.1 TrmB family transcriptional regulator [Halorussus limi]
MEEVQVAVDGLERLGLTEYEARCFVALTRLPHGTAKEIGKVADIPRSRVYETMDRLRERGLVELQEGEPRTFQSVSINTAVRVLRKQYESYFETVEESLRQMEPVFKENQQAVWAINDHEQVTERILDLVADATDEILLIVFAETLLDEELLDALRSADDRGVAVHVGTDAEAVRDTFADAEIDARVFTSELIEWFDAGDATPRIGRLLMTDRGPVLMSALHDEDLPGVPNETAAWSDGIDHGLATFAESVLTYELRENAAEVGDSAVSD